MASGENIGFIEEKYELTSLIKCGNSTAKAYLCSVTPRKDADVLAKLNRCIIDWVIIGNHNKCVHLHLHLYVEPSQLTFTQRYCIRLPRLLLQRWPCRIEIFFFTGWDPSLIRWY